MPWEGPTERMGEVFFAARPQMAHAERSGANVGSPEEPIRHIMEQYAGSLDVRTKNAFLSQWSPQYPCRVFPHIFPYMCGGPEFSRDRRWTRAAVPGAPHVPIDEWVAGMARRVEGQLRADWACIPALRNLSFRWKCIETPKYAVPHKQALAERDRRPTPRAWAR